MSDISTARRHVASDDGIFDGQGSGLGTESSAKGIGGIARHGAINEGRGHIEAKDRTSKSRAARTIRGIATQGGIKNRQWPTAGNRPADVARHVAVDA